MDFKTILPGTLAHKLAAHFCEKPNRKLTSGEICDEFGVRLGTIDALLSSAVKSNVLSRTRETINGANCTAYGPGYALMKWIEENGNKLPADLTSEDSPPAPASAAPAPQPSSPAAALRNTMTTAMRERKSKSRSSTLPPLDPATLTVDEGITLAPAKKGPGAWDGVFTLLTKPGQSTTVPLEYQRALSVAAKHFARRNPGVTIAVGADIKNAARCRVLRQE